MKGKIVCSVCIVCIVLLVACSPQEDKKVSFETLETARLMANENSAFLAKKWRGENAPNTKIKTRGDSTQTSTCPQGDGWASIDLMNENGQTIIKLKCSTYSMAIGCIEAKDFLKRRYAQEEGKCNKEVPFPLPKVAK